MARFVLSHSSAKCFSNCPSQFYHRYVLKDLPLESTPALEKGTRDHTALERRLKYGTALPADLATCETTCAQLAPSNPLVEAPLAMRADGTYCGYWDANAWFRGKPYVVVLNDEHTISCAFDWKSGKTREDPDELRSHAVLMRALHPTLKTMAGHYIWLSSGKPCHRREAHTRPREPARRAARHIGRD
jgi:PD-(D/E)XK nuclease superfamily